VTKLLSLLVPGAVSGALYAIVGTGLVLGYQSTGIFNFGYGAIAFATAYLYFQLHTGQHLAIWWSGLICVLVFAPLMGFVLERILLRRLASAPVYTRIVGTIGLVVALPNLALWIVDLINIGGANLPTNQSVATAPGLGPTPANYFHLLTGVIISTDQIAILAASIVSAGGLWLLLRHTRLGLQMRANVDRGELAELRGISPARVSTVAWVLISILAGLVGVLIVPLFGLDPNTFTLVVLGSLAAVVVAGLRSLPLVFAGGILLGVIQNLVAGYATSFLPSSVAQLPGLLSSVPFILAVIGLIVLGSLTRRRIRNPITEAPRPDHRDGMSALRRRAPWVIAIAALILYTTLGANDFWAGLIAQGLVYAVIFLSFVVVTGFGGMVSLAQATFVTGGGFITGYLVTHQAGNIPVLTSHGHLNFGIALVASAAGMAVVGMAIAFVVRRLGTLLLALATLALGFTGELIFFNINAVSGGSSGYSVNPPSIGSFLNFASPRTFSLLVLGIFGLGAVVIYNLQRTASGRTMYAVRSTETGAQTAGLSPDRIKVLIFGLAAAIAGLGGSLFTVTSSPFGNTSAPTIVGLVWLAVVVTWGIRRPGGALLAGLSFSLGTALFGEITNWNVTVHAATQSPYFLPVLFGLGAIGLAREPDGILAQFSRGVAGARATRADSGRMGPTIAVDLGPAGVESTEKGPNGKIGGGDPAPGELRPRVTTRSIDHEAAHESGSVLAAADGNPTVGERAHGPEAALALENVVAGYGPVEVLHSTSLAVQPGTIVALLGANGAGKTTLCRVAAGLLAPTGGRILRHGVDVTAWPAYRRAEHGLMTAPEGRGIFPGLSVEENLAVWLPTDDERAKAFEHFPVLGRRRKQTAGSLSGGEQQMLALASALVRPPDVFIADEPTLGLAPLASESVSRTLAELRDEGTTILLVEERATEILALADTAAFMVLGRIVWIGPSADVDVDALATTYLGVGAS
jgi:ABC-type branched-subunit amino acid transport system ATPase component/branched-subunit amino acid ABC-type transport system permease component